MVGTSEPVDKSQAKIFRGAITYCIVLYVIGQMVSCVEKMVTILGRNTSDSSCPIGRLCAVKASR
jgi:hypothetical protein